VPKPTGKYILGHSLTLRALTKVAHRFSTSNNSINKEIKNDEQVFPSLRAADLLHFRRAGLPASIKDIGTR